MVTGYRDGKPDIGGTHCGFRSISGLKDFLKTNDLDPEEEDDLWTITGELVRDEGGPDGLVILVETRERLRL